MSSTKVHPPLIRALAHTGLYRWAYCDDKGDVTMDHLIEHGIDAYVHVRTGGGRLPVAVNRAMCVDEGRAFVAQHADAFRDVITSVVNHGARFAGTTATHDGFCRVLSECDDRTLAWWCDHRFAPAMEAKKADAPIS